MIIINIFNYFSEEYFKQYVYNYNLKEHIQLFKMTVILVG